MLNWLKSVLGTKKVPSGPKKKLPRKERQNHPFSQEWDDELNRLMDKYNFSRSGDQHTAQLGPVRIWVSNHPYASMHPYGINVSPSWETLVRAQEKYVKDVYSEGQ